MQALSIGDIPAILAGLALVSGLIFYFWAPKNFLLPSAALVYALMIVATGSLVVTSGGIHSPFIALWMAVSVFAGLFGLYGIGAVLVLVNLYLIYSFIGHSISRSDIIIGALAGELPMFISYILWSGRESLEEARDHDVSNLNKSLEQEESKADAVIQAIGDGVIVVSQTGEILLINPAAQQMTGWPSKDANHLHFESVLKLEDAKGTTIESALNPIARVLNTGQQVREKDISIVTKSGKHISAAFVVSPTGQAGEGAIAVFRDVTKERAEEREQAEFISTASHEMRTPVASIEGYLGLTLNPNTATIDEKARDYITKAHESAQHLGRLFQDLLDVTRADDGRLQNVERVVDVVSFTRSVIEGLLPKATEKKLEVVYRPDGTKSTIGTTVIAPVLYAHVDKDHLREVLGNLTENAIKYTLEGTISVDVTASDEYVRISVKDSGIGIPHEDISHLFQKFYRVDSSDTREIGGTGLGLYLCRKLVESMEGRIWVESEYKKGSTFFVEIPRIDHSTASDLLNAEAREKATAISSTTSPDEQEGPATPVLDMTIHGDDMPKPAPTTPPTPVSIAAPTPVLTPLAQTQSPVPIVTPAPVPTPAPISTPRPFGAVTYVAPVPLAQTPQPPVLVATPAPAPTTPPPAAIPSAKGPMPIITSRSRVNIPLSSLERDPQQYVSKPRNPSNQ